MLLYEFQSTAHRTLSAMLSHIAGAWLTADGLNTDSDVKETLDTCTDEKLAAECINGWGLDRTEWPFDEPSHMDLNGYTVDDLAAAFSDMR